MKLTKKTLYIGLFTILYLIVAGSSFVHALDFFGLANNDWMSMILSFAFEVGQAAVLFSLLTSSKDRSRIMPWVLMGMFTLVQVIGNVYSSYKYIITNSVENLRYFKEPIFIWTDLPDNQATVLIVYIVGAILPICALLLTSMITNYLEDNKEEQLINDIDKDITNIIEQSEQAPQTIPQELTTEEIIDMFNAAAAEQKNETEQTEDLGTSEDEEQQDINEIKQDETTTSEHIADTDAEDNETDSEQDKLEEDPVLEEQPKEEKIERKSHFINL